MEPRSAWSQRSCPLPLHRTMYCVAPDWDNGKGDSLWHGELLNVFLSYLVSASCVSGTGLGLYCQVDLPQMSEKHSLSSRGRREQDASACKKKLMEADVLKPQGTSWAPGMLCREQPLLARDSGVEGLSCTQWHLWHDPSGKTPSWFWCMRSLGHHWETLDRISVPRPAQTFAISEEEQKGRRCRTRKEFPRCILKDRWSFTLGILSDAPTDPGRLVGHELIFSSF